MVTTRLLEDVTKAEQWLRMGAEDIQEAYNRAIHESPLASVILLPLIGQAWRVANELVALREILKERRRRWPKRTKLTTARIRWRGRK